MMKLIQNNQGQFISIPLTPEELAALQPTEYELAMDDWDYPELEQRVRIDLIWIDPDDTTLNPDKKAKLKDNLQYWQLAEFPSKRRNGFAYIYFNSLAPNQLAFLGTIEVTPEPRPVQTEPMGLPKKKM